MRIFYIILWIVLIIAVVVFAVQNTVPVTVAFLGWSANASMSIVLVITLAVGVLLGMLLLLPSVWRRMRALSAQKKKTREVENQLKNAGSTTAEAQPSPPAENVTEEQVPQDKPPVDSATLMHKKGLSKNSPGQPFSYDLLKEESCAYLVSLSLLGLFLFGRAGRNSKHPVTGQKEIALVRARNTAIIPSIHAIKPVRTPSKMRIAITIARNESNCLVVFFQHSFPIVFLREYLKFCFYRIYKKTSIFQNFWSPGTKNLYLIILKRHGLSLSPPRRLAPQKLGAGSVGRSHRHGRCLMSIILALEPR